MTKTPFRILMADDDPDDCLLVRDALKEVADGVDFSCVYTGRELLDYLGSGGNVPESVPATLPDLILLDLNMPQKNGKEVLKEIKADPDLRAIPIVIFTTSSEKTDIDSCLALGASSFVSKPVCLDELIDILRSLSKYGLETT